MAVAAAKARKEGMELITEMREKVTPILDGTHQLLRENSPKVKVITENFAEASHIIREKAREFDVTASDLNARTRAQAARVDGMVSSVLNSTAEITETIQRGIKVPVREVNGIMNGLKAGLDVLVSRYRGFGSGGADVPRDRDPGW
jgi:methyl-accepting chemotaxis protein